MAYKRNRYGSIVLDDGTTITKKMQREYRQKVQNANRKRNRLIDSYYNEIKNTPAMRGISKEIYAQQLQTKGFIPAKLSASFKYFDNRKDFKEELRDIKTMNKSSYQSRKLQNAREIMKRQVKENFNSDGQAILNVISKMTDREFIMMYMSAPNSLIATLYGSEQDMDTTDLADKTLANMEITLKNITPKKERTVRLKQLGF